MIKKWSSTLIFLSILFAEKQTCIGSEKGSIPESEYSALYDLYQSTDGERWNWGNLTAETIPWNFTVVDLNAPCSNNWQGMSCLCADESCNVQQLDLFHHNLTGTLPSTIGSFPNLTNLILSLNNITGTLPIEITNMLFMTELDLHANSIEGTLPSTMGKLTELRSLILWSNLFNGSLPASLYDCKKLIFLQVQFNQFSGTVSNAIGNWVNLATLKLISNYFTGTLPPTISLLQNLSTFEISLNSFNGSIPKELYSLTGLKIIDISQNHFTGRILSEIGNLTSLVVWFCYENDLFGFLPDSWFNPIIPMKSLDLEVNLFSGPLSPLMASWKSTLHSIFIGRNSFTGTISTEFNDIEVLVALWFDTNFFHGNVHGLFLNQTFLTYLDWNQNLLTGTITSSLQWKYLLYYLYSENYFTGTFPINLYNSTYLYYVNVALNYLHGTVPHYFNNGRFRFLTYMNFSNNQFSGGLNDTFENAQSLVTLSLSYNQFTGVIPLGYGNLHQLNYLLLNNNQLSGGIPETVKELRNLQVLFLQDNQLTGTVANSLAWNSLETIDFSNNLLTGTLPFFFTLRPSIKTFAASSNCFHGTIPSIVCNLTSFTVLSIDGMSTAAACRSPIFPGIPLLTAFTLRNSFIGGIPSCVFSMPNLVTLHMSGNGLSGTLPDDILISKTLTDLTLSHNRLSGTIPTSFQNRPWSNLDLSYNKFTGTLSTRFYPCDSTNQSIALQVNRLSGEIPDNLIQARSIELIDGNMFTCNYDRGDLPQHDSTTKNYSCGSDVVNTTLYIWIGICLFFLVVLYVVRKMGSSNSVLQTYCRNSLRDLLVDLAKYILTVKKWRQTFIENCRPPNQQSNYPLTQNNSPFSSRTVSTGGFQRIYKFSLFAQKIRFLFLCLTIVVVCILMPFYAILSQFYHSFTFTYVWILSALLLTGRTAGISMLLLYLITVLCLILLFKIIISPYKTTENRSQSTRQGSIFGSLFKNRFDSSGDGLGESRNAGKEETNGRVDSSFFVPSIYFRESILKEKTDTISYVSLAIVGFGNCLIMIVADVFYVYVILHFDTAIIIIAEMLLATFKILLNNTLLWQAIPLVQDYLDKENSTRRSSIISRGSLFTDYEFEGTIKLYKYTVRDLSFLSFTVFLNNLVFPALAILIISSDCFNNALFAASGVSSTYYYTVCARYAVIEQNCYEYVTYPITSTYSPPFIYSFQCASRIVINYAAVFILMFIFEGFIQPAYKFWVKFLYDRELEKIRRLKTPSSKQHLNELAKAMEEGPTIKDTSIHEVNEVVLENSASNSGQIKTNESVDSNEMKTTVTDSYRSHVTTGAYQRRLSWYYRLLFATLPYNLHQLIAEPSYEIRSALLLFDKNRLVVKLNAYLVVFMSFGVLFPPLALIICVAAISLTMYEETVIGRLFYESDRTGHSWYKKQIDRNCSGVSNSLKYSLWTLVPVSCLMYSYLIFDTWGDSEGWESALAPTILMLILPIFFLLLYSLRRRFYQFFCLIWKCEFRKRTEEEQSPRIHIISADEGKPRITMNALHNSALSIDAEIQPDRVIPASFEDSTSHEVDQNIQNRNSIRRVTFSFSSALPIIANLPAFQAYDGDESDQEDEIIRESQFSNRESSVIAHTSTITRELSVFPRDSNAMRRPSSIVKRPGSDNLIRVEKVNSNPKELDII